jgi:aryl-alcohol dehydrogenase-like predicted oxidoreductase
MVDRRNFLSSSLVGLAGMGLSNTLLGAEEKKAPAPLPKPKKVLRRILGRTGISLPVVSMGVMNADNPALVKAALEGGIVHFDTAHGYQRGRNEEMLGEVFKGVKRDSFTLATKVFPPGLDRRTGVFAADTKPEPFIEMFHLSLKRLQLEHVDILFLHNVTKREALLYEPILKALLQLKKEGKARFIGVSTHSNEPEVIRAATASKAYDVVLTSYNFKQAHHAEVRAACQEAARAGVGIIAMKTQAGVWFDKEKTKPINMAAALKWALQEDCITTAIPGFTTFEQLNLNLGVLGDLKLTESERQDLAIPVKTSGLYCQQCGTCTPQCPHGLPIPDLMRGYMYAAGYRNLQQAKDLAVSLPLADDPCGACPTCTVRCVQDFDIRPRIEELLRLRTVQDAFLA